LNGSKVFNVNLKESLEFLEVILDEFKYCSFVRDDASLLGLLSIYKKCKYSVEGVLIVLLEVFLGQLDEQLLT